MTKFASRTGSGDDMIRTRGARRVAGWGWLALALAMLTGSPQAARAQSSTPRVITVPFAAPLSDDYASGSVDVQYAFLACYGELHLALRLAPGSARSNGVYRMAGKTYTATGAPQISVAKVRGRASRAGSEVIANFTNGTVGPDGGLGCFSGDLTQLGMLAPWLGPKATQAQIVNFLNSLTLQVEPMEAVRNSGLEARLRAEDRQRQAAVEAQQKAEQQSAEARRLAQAKRAEEAARPVSRTPSSAGGGHAPRPQAPATPPRLSDSDRIAAAIASDKVLAEQRLAEQRRVYAQQQATLAAQQQRQNEALIAAAPAIMELGGGIYGAIENFDAQWKSRQYLEAQRKQGGKCLLRNGQKAPKDGDIKLGVKISSGLTKADCGTRPADRYKAFKLELDAKTRIELTVGSAVPWHFTSFMVNVHDLNGRSYLEIGWREWGALQKVLSKRVVLPAGIYIVTVSNGVEDIFAPFNLRVDALDSDGRVLAAAPAAPPKVSAAAALGNGAPPASPTNAPAPLRTAASAGAQVRTVKPSRGAYLGIAVSAGQRAVITTVVAGSPAETAGLRPGDEIHMITGTNSGFFGAVANIRDQTQLDQWLATQMSNAKQSITILRDKEVLTVIVTPTAQPAFASID